MAFLPTNHFGVKTLFPIDPAPGASDGLAIIFPVGRTELLHTVNLFHLLQHFVTVGGLLHRLHLHDRITGIEGDRNIGFG